MKTRMDIEECKRRFDEIFELNDMREDSVMGMTFDCGQIDLSREEEYDASLMKCWSFRKSEDVRDGIRNNLGNMCSGYPFKLGGIAFAHSEGAYELGMFSDGSDAAMDVQRQILAERNGFMVKKRVKRRHLDLIRSDWETFRVQWMFYVVWQKCLGNRDFARVLTSVPADAMIVEDSSAQHGDTAMLWGTKNPMLQQSIKVIENYLEMANPLKTKKIVNEKKMLERNRLTRIGVFRGINVMGKILKLCQMSLLEGTVPPIDFALLESRRICLLGEPLRLGTSLAA